MDTPNLRPAPPVDPVVVPDVATEPHPGTEPVAGGVGPIPTPLPGLGDNPDAAGAFRSLPDLARPAEPPAGE